MKKALLVGINAYPAIPLEGCINDVNAVSAFLTKHCDFNSTDILPLKDPEADKKGILNGISWLLSTAGAGDHIFLYLSGHGSRMASKDQNGKIDGLHDVFCPIDYDLTPETAIFDTDFQKLFSNLPSGLSFTWMADSCYSGNLGIEFLKGNTHFKFMPESAAMQADIDTAKKMGFQPFGFASAIQGSQALFLSACEENRLAQECHFTGVPGFQGVFTHFLLQALKNVNGLKKPMSAIATEITMPMVNNGFGQIAQLHGPESQKALPFLQ